jgi:hypothetical protein
MDEYKQHPLSMMFTPMKKNAFRNLCDDIFAHGLLMPIVLFEGMILDGWHRYLACLEKDVTPRFVDFEGDTTAALEYVKIHQSKPTALHPRPNSNDCRAICDTTAWWRSEA